VSRVLRLERPRCALLVLVADEPQGSRVVAWRLEQGGAWTTADLGRVRRLVGSATPLPPIDRERARRGFSD
jgi:hypothetical protein